MYIFLLFVTLIVDTRLVQYSRRGAYNISAYACRRYWAGAGKFVGVHLMSQSRYLGPAASLNIAYQNNESYIAPSTLPRTDGETNLDTSTAKKMIFRNELKCIHY